MPTSLQRIRQHIQAFEFGPLFIDELGWDRHSLRLPIGVEGENFTLECVAQKRGFHIFKCEVPAGHEFPLSAVRNKVSRHVSKSAHEHLIIFVDHDQSTQVWQTPERRPGRAWRFHYHEYRSGQSGQSLAQKVRDFVVTLDEEASLTLPDVLERTRSLHADRITRRFYEAFKQQYKAFMGFVEGLPDPAMKEWYSSIMLNRLMFVYFIQRKGFLDGDVHYLRKRLADTQKVKGQDEFHSFYRYFLLRLFHEGLGQHKKDRDSQLEDLLGDVPYLNGGLFDIHELERDHPDEIQIADEAFKQLFDFFDQYQWHLDDRALRNDNEINPDVLGYIFEKYINLKGAQKESGAYYTKEDITEYISRNTIIPFLFDSVQEKCEKCDIAVNPQGTGWKLLTDEPQRYVFDAVGHGLFVDVHTGELLDEPRPLPEEIAAGIDDVTARGDWNQSAPPEFALPTETWREVIARRSRCEDLLKRLSSGQITQINDFITYNLDICRFAEDVIRTSEGSELLRAFYVTIAGRQPRRSTDRLYLPMSVLDPTCGSGAFLFAALNILEPLYEACLERMEEMLDDEARLGHKQRLSDFRQTLKQIDEHPNRKYFIYKSIIIGNLYGVDIMPEAVEICKLRLFLKLVSQVDTARELEPLPDADFNIRPGNTLVGFVGLDEIRKAASTERVGTHHQSRMIFSDTEDEISEIEKRAKDVDRGYRLFRQQQVQLGGHVTARDKQALRNSLHTLTSSLDTYLAGEFGIDSDNAEAFDEWRTTHLPFHWFAEFYGIMSHGGFDVTIGNPPYVSVRKLSYEYLRLTACPDVYAEVVVRTCQLAAERGRSAMIVPLSLTFSRDFGELRERLRLHGPAWISSFDNIPAAVFHGVSQRCTIWIGQKGKEAIFVGQMVRWRSPYRPFLTTRITYVDVATSGIGLDTIPKVDNSTIADVVRRLEAAVETASRPVVSHASPESEIGVSPSARNFISAYLEPPPVLDAKSLKQLEPSGASWIPLQRKEDASAALAVLVGDVFFLYWLVRGDGFHMTSGMSAGFLPVLSSLSEEGYEHMVSIGQLIHSHRREALAFKKNAGKFVGNFNYRQLQRLTRRGDLLLLNSLGLDYDSCVDIFGYVDRVLSINEFAGEKAIPASVHKCCGIDQPSKSADTRLPDLDRYLCSQFGISHEQLAATCVSNLEFESSGKE